MTEVRTGGIKILDVRFNSTLPDMPLCAAKLAEVNQAELGAIIAYEYDQRIRRALNMTPSIVF